MERREYGDVGPLANYIVDADVAGLLPRATVPSMVSDSGEWLSSGFIDTLSQNIELRLAETKPPGHQAMTDSPGWKWCADRSFSSYCKLNVDGARDRATCGVDRGTHEDWKVAFQHVLKEGNKVADRLTKVVNLKDIGIVVHHSPSLMVATLLQQDR
ncbi:hypothetical protein V6N13_129967 [Hibiscus sabdariffa]